jgi:hypothetical protein
MPDRPLVDSPDLADLTEYLERSSRLSAGEAARVIDDVLGYLNETVDEFVRRRHRALQSDGLANAEIYARIGAELAQLRFRAPALSERQIRRMVYG